MAGVSLEAPQGGLPDENLEPLLRVAQGEALDPREVRQDLELLFRTGVFSSVEAHVEPWPVFEADGSEAVGVRIAYRVAALPRVARIEVMGLAGDARRIAEDAAGIDRGDAWYADQKDDVQARVEEALAAAGWTKARARVAAKTDREGDARIRIFVREGKAVQYGTITVAGDLVVPERTIRRWIGKHDVREGERVVQESLQAARTELLDGLVKRGWLSARVNVVFFPAPPGTADEPLSVLVEAGPRLRIRTRDEFWSGGFWSMRTQFPFWWSPQWPRFLRKEVNRPSLADVLDLSPGARVTPGTIEDARQRLVDWYQERGYFAAEVVAELEPDRAARRARSPSRPDDQKLVLVTEPGDVHRLRHVAVDGATTFSAGEVEAVLKEAEPDTLGRRIVTPRAADHAVGALVEYYRGQGFLDARAHVASIETGKGWFGVPVTLSVEVEEGVRTTLEDLRATGGLGLEDELLADARERMLGKPFGPAVVDALARDVVDIYREEGYLMADARVETAISDDRRSAAAVMSVAPGSQVRLRSVIIQGNVRTRRSVVERDVEVVVGEPIRPSAVQRTRSNLYALDLFQVVDPNLVGDDDRSRDLVLELEERPNILLEAGGGVSTDKGVTVTGRAAHRNVAGLGYRVSGLAQAGLGWAGEEWRIDTAQPEWRSAVRFEAPWVPGRGQRLIVDGLLNEVLQEPNFRLERSGASIGLSMRVDATTEALVDYHLQWRRLDDVEPGALVVGDPWLPFVGVGPDDEELVATGAIVPDTPSLLRLQEGVGLQVVRDRRDDRLNPTRGHYASGLVDVADGLLARPAMLRASSRFERLTGLGPFVLDVVGLGGLAWVEGIRATLPVEDRFYLGGGATLRGIPLDTVGPANLAQRPDVDYPSQIEPWVDGTALRREPAQWVATGGDSMAALSAELRVPMPVLGFESLDGASIVVFSDNGHVGFLDPTITTTSLLEGRDSFVRSTVGAGIRIATPIGPASFDVGYNPWPMSERHEPNWLPHLSLGSL